VPSPSIQFIQRAGLLLLNVAPRAQDADFAQVPDLLAERLGLPGTPPLSGIVVDMTQAADINEAEWKKLSAHLEKIPGRNKFFIVAMPPAMAPLISAKGGVAAELVASVDAVFAKLSAKRAATPSSVNAKKNADDAALERLLVQTFQNAALKTMEIQCETKFVAGAPHLKSAGPRMIYDIAASMGMMSKGVSGTVAIGFKEATFLTLMKRMIGEEYTGITTEVEDGCGEIINIIFGQAKSELIKVGHAFGKTLPLIFVGQSLRVRQLTPNPGLVIPFESDVGPMVLELGYRKN
jgi:chemotaxis protein CheX